RELLQELMDFIGIEKDVRGQAIIALDKLKKIGSKGVAEEMREAGVDKKKIDQLLELTNVKGTNAEKIAFLRKSLPAGKALDTLEEILDILSSVENLVFDPSLARGLEYYTGFFFECFLNDSKITSSLVGTGRYDKIIGQFLGGKQDFAAVGISFGVSVICDALREKNPELKKSLTQVYVVPVSRNERSYALEIARKLRQEGFYTDMDLVERGIGKNFAFADALGIPFVAVVGEEEKNQQKISVKNMQSGEQQKVDFEEMLKILKTN